MEQNKLEDRLQQADARAEALVTEKKNAVRQQRDLERSHEGERLAMAKERDDMVLREKELVSVVQRLKEKLSAKRDTKGNLDEEGHMSRSCKHPMLFYPDSRLMLLQPSTWLRAPMVATLPRRLLSSLATRRAALKVSH